MKIDDILDIMDCLSEGRTKFYYFKDRYALMLLSHIVGKGMAIRDLKESRFNRLIRKPVVRKLMEVVGDGYRLTLDIWGDRDKDARFYNQTSRPGWNLVLQMNFSNRHNRSYCRMLKPR